MWGIWKNLNEVLYAGKAVNPHITLAQVFEETEHWFKQTEITGSEMTANVKEKWVLERTWSRPCTGILKCNIHPSWINGNYDFGGAWILRDSTGLPIYHARDVFLPMSNRLSAELSRILWAVHSHRDLRLRRVELWSDCGAAIEALSYPGNWPHYGAVLH